MKFNELFRMITKTPLFNSKWLLAGSDAAPIYRQLDRWVKDGKIVQLKRGWYLLSEPYRNELPHPYFIANQLKPASYISLQSALEYYGMIPEYVPVVTSVTTGRPESVITEIGHFSYTHIKKTFFHSFHTIEITSRESVFMASPEKALLDLVYLTPRADTIEYLDELRLQNLINISRKRLKEIATISGSKKLERVVSQINKMIPNQNEKKE